MIAFILILALLFTLGDVVWYSWRYGISPTPTSPKVQSKILEILPSMNEGVIFELGSGWGTLACAVAKKFPRHRVDGFEISLFPYLFSLGYKKLQGCDRVNFYREDFFEVDLSQGILIICYLYPRAMERLKSKFENELSSGTWVLTHTFAIPGWEPFSTHYAQDLYKTPIYLYQL